MGSAFDAHAPAAGFRLRGAEKLAFVSDMFDRVAPTYDLLNHFISLGQTTLWRVLALSWLHDLLPKHAKVLDVGCGTGWVTWYLRRRYPSRDLDIEGMDCSPVMLDEARRVVPGAEFTHGDVCALKHADGTFDAVTTVYTLRNFPDLRRGVEEMYRVTKPGGSVVILDAFPPSNLVVKSVLYVWLELVMPVVAGLVTRDKKAYRYLSASIRSTVPPEMVAETLRAAGAEAVVTTRYTFGTAARIVARKPTTEAKK
jgi:demethylmenaquinone methyltransferase/2-methoxy-6-polyprenyl-1,4-benzoquinol methylase